jgi:hypothetical protein
MRNEAKTVTVLALALGLAVSSGCGKSDPRTEKAEKKPASVEVKYTTGSAKPGAFDKSDELELSGASFDGSTVVFTYKNLNNDAVGGWVFGVIARTFNDAGAEVDKVEKVLYPGEVSLPCNAKIISIPTDTKQQTISRVEVEHIGTFSRDRFRGSLDTLMGR